MAKLRPSMRTYLLSTHYMQDRPGGKNCPYNQAIDNIAEQIRHQKKKKKKENQHCKIQMSSSLNLEQKQED